MTSASESRAALRLVTSAAIATTTQLWRSVPERDRRAAVLETVPALITYYADGSSALAADFYDDQRELAGAGGSFLAEPFIADRGEKIGRALAWATDADGAVAEARLADVVQLETARPYRDTIIENRRRDPKAVGWRRVTAGGCAFCRMLADKGAIYRESTARFASHENCNCTAQPVFDGQPGDEAGVMQYVASKRRRSDADRKRLRDYLAANYGE